MGEEGGRESYSNFVDQPKECAFYSRCTGEPLKGFKQM